MRENRDFVVPVNTLTTFAHAPFSWAARHTTVCYGTNTAKGSDEHGNCLLVLNERCMLLILGQWQFSTIILQ